MSFLFNKYRHFLKRRDIQPKIAWIESHCTEYRQSDTGLIDTTLLFEELLVQFPDIQDNDKPNYQWLVVSISRQFEQK